MTCQITHFGNLQREARLFIREKQGSWPPAAIPLGREYFLPQIQDHIIAMGHGWRLKEILKPDWTVGLGCEVPRPDRSTHFHTDLGDYGVHVDYFRFMSYGPVIGIEGFLVSRGEVLAAGGHWGQPPAGGQRNWPLGVLLTDRVLLSICGNIRIGAGFLQNVMVADWKRDC